MRAPARPRQRGYTWSRRCRFPAGALAPPSRPLPSAPPRGLPSPPRVDEEGEAGQHHQQVDVGGFVPRLVHRVIDGAAVQRRRAAAAAGPPDRRRHGGERPLGAAPRRRAGGRREVTSGEPSGGGEVPRLRFPGAVPA